MKRSQVLEIKRLKLQGKTTKEIAEEMNRTEVTIRRWLKRLRDAGHDVPKDKSGPKELNLKQLD